MKFKHLTPDSFTDNPFQQPSMEGLWDDIIKIFGGDSKPKEFNYYSEERIFAFFEMLKDKKVQFKSEPFPAGSRAALLVQKGKIPDNIFQQIEKEISFFKTLLSGNTDEQYASIVSEVYAKANAARTKDVFAKLVREYSQQLNNTPVVEKLNRDILDFPKQKLIDGNGHFYDAEIYFQKKEDAKVNIVCCEHSGLEKIIGLVKDLSELNRQAHSKSKTLVYKSNEDIGSFWSDSDSNGQQLMDWLLDYHDGSHYPYLCEVVKMMTWFISAALCYWVRESLVSLKGL